MKLWDAIQDHIRRTSGVHPCWIMTFASIRDDDSGVRYAGRCSDYRRRYAHMDHEGEVTGEAWEALKSASLPPRAGEGKG